MVCKNIISTYNVTCEHVFAVTFHNQTKIFFKSRHYIIRLARLGIGSRAWLRLARLGIGSCPTHLRGPGPCGHYFFRGWDGVGWMGWGGMGWGTNYPLRFR